MTRAVAGDIVWEYVNAYPRRGRDPVTDKSTINHQLYRAQPVPYEWVPPDVPRSQQAVTAPNAAGSG